MARFVQLVTILVIAMAVVYSCEAMECTGGPNDVKTECGTPCPKTCANRDPQICTLNCIINTCQCKEGYYRNDDGQCVTLEECGNKKSE